MGDLTEQGRLLFLQDSEAAGSRVSLHRFIEELTFADADDILAMLRELKNEDWLGLPVYVRNLAYRLVCLQKPDDPVVLREAGADLYLFGLDWDDIAADLEERAARLGG